MQPFRARSSAHRVPVLLEYRGLEISWPTATAATPIRGTDLRFRDKANVVAPAINTLNFRQRSACDAVPGRGITSLGRRSE